METAKERGLSIRYEATAGAGLPVLDTIAKLQRGRRPHRNDPRLFFRHARLPHDGAGGWRRVLRGRARSVEARLHRARSARRSLRHRRRAQGADPGAHARTSRRARTRSNSSRFSATTSTAPIRARSSTSLGALDDAYRERVERARAERQGAALRRENPQPRDPRRHRSRSGDSPLGSLRGTANQVAIYSKRYKTNPLVVTGPGAGAKVTAAGVLNDIVAITMEERRRRRAMSERPPSLPARSATSVPASTSSAWRSKDIGDRVTRRADRRRRAHRCDHAASTRRSSRSIRSAERRSDRRDRMASRASATSRNPIITIDKGLPLAGGLGGSAASSVAGALRGRAGDGHRRRRRSSSLAAALQGEMTRRPATSRQHRAVDSRRTRALALRRSRSTSSR